MFLCIPKHGQAQGRVPKIIGLCHTLDLGRVPITPLRI